MSLASIDHAADPESTARDRRLVLLDRTVAVDRYRALEGSVARIII
ncbi:hypothetical protein Taro_021667 [Colocasia esculenta]|uniref:Uncharacterized protein n=1 Tax=Colocasia esculenta TaxID=4460 RepID=A0A843V623_COLES|nr:hypothetical protein [Colocasia esculenta]